MMHNLAFLLLQSTPDQETATRLALAFLGILPILILIGIAILIVPAWFICKKAGFSPWLSFLCLVPSIGLLVLLYVLAFADWPSQRPQIQAGWANPPLPPQPPYPQG